MTGTATVPPPPQRLLVFARLPERGAVKTRLAATIGDERALAVYEALLSDVLGAIGEPSLDTEIEILWAPAPTANGERLRQAFGARSVAMQTGATLGDRMAMAFSERFFFHRTEKIIAIGVDEPRITRALIDHAFALLDSCEWVVGPAVDGGYYLIGCRAAAFDANLFDAVAWGTSEVLPVTLAKIAAANATVAQLPPRRDIDVADDLDAFRAESANANGALAALLKGWTA
jgi:rSAM/selenodomain-associated transferase 1